MDKVKTFVSLDENNTVENISTINYSDRIVDLESLNAKNGPTLGYTFNETIGGFIPPQPNETYILKESNCRWYPDPSLEYMIDDIAHKWDPVTYQWYQVTAGPPDPDIFFENLRQSLASQGYTTEQIDLVFASPERLELAIVSPS